MEKTSAKPSKKLPNQGDTLRKFGAEVVTYYVGESARSPGEIQIGQYSSRLAGPFTPAQARELAAALLAGADALEQIDPTEGLAL